MLRASIVWLLVPFVLAEEDHDEDNHTDEEPFEWAGIFAMPAESYVWRMQKVDGAYAREHMKMVLLPAAAGTEALLHSLEGEAGHSFEATCTEVEAGGTLVPAEDTCYDLHVDPNSDDSGFLVQASGTPFVAFFAEHLPTEFERDMHYLKDLSGADIAPLAEESHGSHGSHGSHASEAAASTTRDKPWGAAIGAAVLVCLCTMVGVVFLVPCVGRVAKDHPNVFSVVTNAFAAGALLAAAFFLLLFEATYLVATSDEALDAASWGIAILAGFLIPSVIDFFASLIPTKGEGDDNDAEAGGAAKRVRVLVGVLVGDFIHNVCDGVFIGTAFAACSDSAGWSLALASIYHEIAQEISDFFVMTDKSQGNLNPLKALALNFVSGLGVILGAIIILAQDSVDNKTTGVLLGIAGGVYIQIGACECMAKVHALADSARLRAGALLVFVVGAALLGLVLLTHEHCVPEGGAAGGGGGHDGHNH